MLKCESENHQKIEVSVRDVQVLMQLFICNERISEKQLLCFILISFILFKTEGEIFRECLQGVATGIIEGIHTSFQACKPSSDLKQKQQISDSVYLQTVMTPLSSRLLPPKGEAVQLSGSANLLDLSLWLYSVGIVFKFLCIKQPYCKETMWVLSPREKNISLMIQASQQTFHLTSCPKPHSLKVGSQTKKDPC